MGVLVFVTGICSDGTTTSLPLPGLVSIGGVMADCSNVDRDSVSVMWTPGTDSSTLLFPCFRDPRHQSAVRIALLRVGRYVLFVG